MQAQGGLVALAANRQLGKSDREAAGVLSAAQRHTHFLDSPRMATVLGSSDYTFAGLKDAPATVFLVLPPDRLASSCSSLGSGPIIAAKLRYHADREFAGRFGLIVGGYSLSCKPTGRFKPRW